MWAWPILNTNRVTVYFVIKLLNFRYHGNGGWSETNFTELLANPENAPWCKSISHLQAVAIANSVLKFINFPYYGNKDRSGRRLNDNVQLADTYTAPIIFVTKILGPILNTCTSRVILFWCINFKNVATISTGVGLKQI